MLRKKIRLSLTPQIYFRPTCQNFERPFHLDDALRRHRNITAKLLFIDNLNPLLPSRIRDLCDR
jgi:hypothetical protein